MKVHKFPQPDKRFTCQTVGEKEKIKSDLLEFKYW